MDLFILIICLYALGIIVFAARCYASAALRGVYSDTTQLNSTEPVEQPTAKSVVFLFMTSRPTN